MGGRRAGLSPERIAGLHVEVAAIEATEESDDGLIAATVGPLGQLRGLELDPRVYRNQDPDALAADILSTVRAAADTARQRPLDVADLLLPDGADPESADLAFDPALHELDRMIAGPGY